MQQSRREAIQRGADGVPTVPNLGVALESARVSAAVNSLLGSDNQRSPSAIKLPFASVSKFDLTLHCRGGPVGIDDATISCEPFSGSERATSDHVVDHYAAIVRRRAPYLLIAKTNVAGVNVADSASMIAGKVVTSASVIGATVGVVSRDMVGSALTQGKESRGASATDKNGGHKVSFSKVGAKLSNLADASSQTLEMEVALVHCERGADQASFRGVSLLARPSPKYFHAKLKETLFRLETKGIVSRETVREVALVYRNESFEASCSNHISVGYAHGDRKGSMTLSQLRAKARPMQELWGVQLALIGLIVEGDSTADPGNMATGCWNEEHLFIKPSETKLARDEANSCSSAIMPGPKGLGLKNKASTQRGKQKQQQGEAGRRVGRPCKRPWGGNQWTTAARERRVRSRTETNGVDGSACSHGDEEPRQASVKSPRPKGLVLARAGGRVKGVESNLGSNHPARSLTKENYDAPLPPPSKETTARPALDGDNGKTIYAPADEGTARKRPNYEATSAFDRTGADLITAKLSAAQDSRSN
ncbi:hypothetical protein THAOC_27081, partial [Thalassiosira oceanica]